MLSVGLQPLVPIQAMDHLEPQPDGTVTAVFADGEVLSIQPDGSQQRRPAGTAGPYEKATLCGNVLVYGPYPDQHTGPYAFACFSA